MLQCPDLVPTLCQVACIAGTRCRGLRLTAECGVRYAWDCKPHNYPKPSRPVCRILTRTAKLSSYKSPKPKPTQATGRSGI